MWDAFKHSGSPTNAHGRGSEAPQGEKGKGSQVTIAHCFRCVNQECFGSLEVINQLNPGEVGRRIR